jgi:hypothetical protein
MIRALAPVMAIPAREESGDPVAAAQAQPGAPQVAHPDSAPEPAPNPAPNAASDAPPPSSDVNFDPNQPSLRDPVIPPALDRLPDATNSVFAALQDSASSFSSLFHKKKPLCAPPPLKSQKGQILSNFRRDKKQHTCCSNFWHPGGGRDRRQFGAHQRCRAPSRNSWSGFGCATDFLPIAGRGRGPGSSSPGGAVARSSNSSSGSAHPCPSALSTSKPGRKRIKSAGILRSNMFS